MFNSAALTIDQAGQSAVANAKHTIKEINDVLSEVAQLNKEIVFNRGLGGTGDELIDTQQQALRKLSSMVGVDVLSHDDGTVSVFMNGGTSLVTGIHKSALLLDGGGAVPIGIKVTKIDGSVVKPIGVIGGQLGGLIEAKEGTLASASAQLDELAFGFVEKINAVHMAGFGTDGTTGNALFEPIAAVAGAASKMSVVAGMEDTPWKVAAAKDPTLLPGDNSNMLEMVNMQDDDTMIGGVKSFYTAYDDVVSTVSVALNRGAERLDVSTARVERYMEMRDSEAAVSIQERDC
jgi:flagellar hook-associated protein 1 FlgK